MGIWAGVCVQFGDILLISPFSLSPRVESADSEPWAHCGANCTLTLPPPLEVGVSCTSFSGLPALIHFPCFRNLWKLAEISPLLMTVFLFFYSRFLFVPPYLSWGAGILGGTGANPFAWCAFWTGSTTGNIFHPKGQPCQAGVSFLCHRRHRGSVCLSNWS